MPFLNFAVRLGSSTVRKPSCLSETVEVAGKQAHWPHTVQEEPEVGQGRWTGPREVNADAGREETWFLRLLLPPLPLVRIPILINSVVTHSEGRARVRSSPQLWLS